MRAEELYKPRGRPRLAGAVLAWVPVFTWPGDGAQGSPALEDTETTHSHVFHSPPHPLGCPACQLQPLSIPTGQAPQQFSMPEGVPSVTILCSPAGPSRRSCKPWRRLSPPPTIGLRSTGSGARRDLRARGSRAAQPFPPN